MTTLSYFSNDFKHTMSMVSVVVPVRNGAGTIKSCINSILNQAVMPDQFELVVVDNGSEDRTAEIVKHFPVHYVCEKRRGISYARNRGIEASKGGIIAFTDADCVVSTNWLMELVQAFRDSAVGITEGETIAFPPSTPVDRYMARRGTYSYQLRRKNPLYPFFGGANVAFRREVFDVIGIFDPGFPGAEDIDLSWRFSQYTSMKCHYNPKAVVFHRNRTTVKSFWCQQVRTGYGLAALRRKYPSRLPWGLAREFRAWASVGQWGAKAVLWYLHSQGDPKVRVKMEDAYFTFLRKLAIRIGFVTATVWGRRT